ncbi:fumarylacetoacetate hydrolase family protein [Mycobacterium sp. NBC_00419]|uniref:2-keto-4-pentenoate hydratase n=1 Tax=Mycobacterium sp. NBC_00419 TaxID=2975989 RepID=UPI002E21FF9F
MDESVRALLAAYRTGEPVAPLVSSFPGLTIDDAYRIQLAQVAVWVGGGRRVLGRKVGLTSPAMQTQMNVAQPDFGHLMDDMFFPEHVPIPAARFLQPRAEPEVAFVLGRDLAGPGVTVAAAAAAVAFALPALEIIDSRIAEWQIGIVDTISDNASSGGVVLGSTARRIGEVDLRLGGCVLHRNGEIAGTGAGGAVLGSPLNSLAWLANTLGERGEALHAGQVILPGSITASIPFQPGDVITATLAGLGSVTAVIAADGEQS